MWKWLKCKKETKLTQIVSEKTIREALADKNLKSTQVSSLTQRNLLTCLMKHIEIQNVQMER